MTKSKEKMGLSYLSWAWAWGDIKSKYRLRHTQFMMTSSIPMIAPLRVLVTVTVEDQDHMMWLPVMDNRNNAISGPTSRQISDARMRCFAKAIAMHGLGHYIYAGEDISQSDGEARQSEGKKNPKPTHQKKEKGSLSRPLRKKFN